jgi:hypothetical protein
MYSHVHPSSGIQFRLQKEILEIVLAGAVVAEGAKIGLLLYQVLSSSPLLTQLTLVDFDSPSNSPKSSSAHLSKRKRILVGENLIMQCCDRIYMHASRLT